VETAHSHESTYVAPLLDAVCTHGLSLRLPRWTWATTTTASTPSAPSAAWPLSFRCERTRASATYASPARATSGAAFTDAVHASSENFGRLKHHYGLAILRVRGIERVRL